MTTTMISCTRGRQPDTVKVQLDIPKRVLEAYKEKAAAQTMTAPQTAKQIMENMLTNWIDGVSAK